MINSKAAARYFIIYFLLFYCTSDLTAQEVKTPLLRNVQLGKQVDGSVEKNATLSLSKKAGSNFPFIEHFLFNGQPSNIKWINAGTEVASRRVVFNAISSTGNVYLDPLQPADVLTTRPIDITGVQQRIFASFTVSSGSTFTPGDSMTVEAKDVFGIWQTVWRSNGNLLQQEEVIFYLDGFISTDFALRWRSYTSNLQSSNTQVFLLSKVVVSQSLPFPFYESIKTSGSKDSVTLPAYFSSPDVRALDSTFDHFTAGQSLRLDAFDALNQAHSNGSMSYGGADTLTLNPFNVQQFAPNDSIYFSFAAMGLNGLLPTDSLLVELRNNLGNWVRTFAIAGSNNNSFNSYSININRGRNRHTLLQVRFIFKTTYSASSKAAWLVTGFRINRRIEMPFVDDFSASRKSTDPAKWADNFVYINNDFPVNHPSINVATFDGLNQSGNPYSPFPVKGTGDVLTSQPFNLSQLGKADSLIISFYYQYEPQGTTNQVYPDDSLILDLRSSRFDNKAFVTVWKTNARDSFFQTFQRIDYVVKDSQYFHDDFQFRIRNYGSLSGNVSQWHVDYVRFNKGRKVNDAYYDVALTNAPAVMAGRYSSMPWNHYMNNPSNFFNGPDSIRIANHNQSAHLVNYYRSVIKPEGDTLQKFVNVLGNLPPQSSMTRSVGQAFDFSTAVTADSLVFNTRYKLNLGAAATDNIVSNDTFSRQTIFSNYFAYDDGTAEGGYGIALKTNVGACLQYKLEEPDSIFGVYIMFNQSEKNVSTQRFNIKVWERISSLFEPALNDKVIYSQEVNSPVYTNTVNGFAAFRFAQAIAVKDSFYIGWDQVNSFVLNVGLDKNYPFGVNPYMAYKMDGRWYPTEIPGALMIRPIVGKFIEVPVMLEEAQKRQTVEIAVYPNPASGSIHINHPDAESFSASLVDLAGRKIGDLVNMNGSFALPAVPGGLYLLILHDKSQQVTVTRKIMIVENH